MGTQPVGDVVVPGADPPVPGNDLPVTPVPPDGGLDIPADGGPLRPGETIEPAL